jgi:hypothetical protein
LAAVAAPRQDWQCDHWVSDHRNRPPIRLSSI